MLAVDTNVLIRLLVDDPDAREQCERARARVKDEDRVYVPFVAVIEAILSVNVDFADCAIHAEAQREGVGLLSFDRKLERLGGVEVLRA